MREQPKVEKWVVYETLTGPNIGMRAVCTAGEWNKIQLNSPGQNQLVMEGITDETTAEKLARGTSGDQKPRAKKARPIFESAEERSKRIQE